MGTEQSKPRTSSYRSSVSFEILNGSIAFSNGDKYVGDFKDGQLTGNGTYYYINNDVYKGDWRCNKKQGFGIQIYAKEDKKYVGHWQDNLPYGEGTLYYSDGSYYVGSFLEGEKHGEGVFYDTEGDDYEEEWANGELKRRSPLSPFKQRQTSSHTSSTANKREIGSKEELNENNSDNQDESEAKSAPKSEGNENKSESDEDFSDSRKKQNRNKDKDYDDKQLHSNILFKSQNEYDSSDVKTYDLGLETLNIIEHMDMLNSVAGVLLNKDVQEWTFKDVGDWLRHLGLNDYVEAFKKNHINGQVLFEITEADLKDEFGMTSVGHRKNFVKAVENLKRIFCDENEKNSEYVRHKIQKFYERNRPAVGGRSLFAGLRSREGRFYSHRFNSRNTYHSQHEVIDEDDELDLKNEPTPSPQMVQRKKTFEGKDEFSRLTEQISKITSPKPKKPAWDAVDDSNIKSLEDVEEARQNENPFRGNPSKRTLSKISSESQKSSPAKEEQNMLKQDHHDIAEEFKSSHSKKNDKLSSISGSSSDSSTDSEPSDDEKLAKANPEKGREDAIPAEVGFLKIGKAASKNDKKMTKKNTAGSLHNFKSAELPVIQRSMSNKAMLGKKPRRKHPQSKENLNEKIKDEILRIFKDSGLNENFIIDYNELTFDKKIGEGGYGRVFLGKFSGIDVAIKEYGKTKLDVRRAEDFVKEVEVISNLRHPNIVLCMGACIHNGKYLMITEYLEEGSLFDHLHKKHTKIQDETMINIIEDIALGMCYLHGRKVFHCDLKSSNILIDSSWSVKLCDFGLSRVKYKSDRKRFQKQRVGTPHWMAPEILRGEKYDESADVYSFGMILWELVMGEIPYHNTPISDIIATVGYEGKQINLPIKGNALILSIMKSCLSLNKYERPTFKQIVDQLQQKTKGAVNVNKKNNLFSIFGS